MSDGTKIEWTDATVNAVNGCSVLSPGCTNCYAMRLAGTRLKHHESRVGLTTETKAGPVWNGTTKLNEKALLQPLAWTRPRNIFWSAHGDLFHDSVPDEWIDKCFAVMAMTPQHSHQVLTKRSARMREYMSAPDRRANIMDAASHLTDDWKVRAAGVWHMETWPLSNVWLGVSVEDQQRADERIPDLLATPAAVRFLSCEPLLGPIDLTLRYDGEMKWDTLAGNECDDVGNGTDTDRIGWVIVGGESGPGARPMHPDWARQLRDQCAAAGVAFLFKQWGNWAPAEGDAQPGDHMLTTWPEGSDGFIRKGVLMRHVGKKAAGRLLDGVQHDGMPTPPP